MAYFSSGRTVRWTCGANTTAWDTAANWIDNLSATGKPATGDTVVIDTAMMVNQKYPATPQAASVTIYSLTISVAAGVLSPNLLTAGATPKQVVVQHDCTFVDAVGTISGAGALLGATITGTPNTATLVFGDGVEVCTASIVAQPGTSGSRTSILSLAAGSTLSLGARPHQNATDVGTLALFSLNNNPVQFAGAVTVIPVVGSPVAGSPSPWTFNGVVSTGGTVTYNTVMLASQAVVLAGGTITANYPVVFVFGAAGAAGAVLGWNSGGFVLHAPTVILSTVGTTIIGSNNCLVLTDSPLTLANFDCGAYTLNVTETGNCAVTTVDVTGSVTVTGATPNAPYGPVFLL